MVAPDAVTDRVGEVLGKPKLNVEPGNAMGGILPTVDDAVEETLPPVNCITGFVTTGMEAVEAAAE